MGGSSLGGRLGDWGLVQGTRATPGSLLQGLPGSNGANNNIDSVGLSHDMESAAGTTEDALVQ